MKLQALKRFRDKIKKQPINIGEFVITEDIDRVNNLVASGLCKIISIKGNELEEKVTNTDKVIFQNKEWDFDVIKKALNDIGVSISATAKVKGVSDKLETLTEEQKELLVQHLSE